MYKIRASKHSITKTKQNKTTSRNEVWRVLSDVQMLTQSRHGGLVLHSLWTAPPVQAWLNCHPPMVVVLWVVNNNWLKQAGNQEESMSAERWQRMYSMAQIINGWIKSSFWRACCEFSLTWKAEWPLGPGKSRWNALSRASHSCRSSSQQCSAMWGCTSCQTPAGDTVIIST